MIIFLSSPFEPWGDDKINHRHHTVKLSLVQADARQIKTQACQMSRLNFKVK